MVWYMSFYIVGNFIPFSIFMMRSKKFLECKILFTAESQI